MCNQHAGKSVENRLLWLREHLAVCIDWSAMDRIDMLSLTAADELPAIEGTGTPMRVYSAAAMPSGKVAKEDYWPNLGKILPRRSKANSASIRSAFPWGRSEKVLKPELSGRFTSSHPIWAPKTPCPN